MNDHRASAYRRHLLVWAVAAVAALSLVACSDDSSDGASNDDTTATTTAPEQFSGTVEEFYEVPDPLPEGEPGQLIRTQEVSSEDGRTTLRIMYHSRDSVDQDRAVTGIVTYPEADAPEGGWPVLATANGTVGLAPQCALSRNGNPGNTFGMEGVAVVTDYIGLGPVGELHPYFSRLAEAHSVIDGVRAARNIPEANAGDEWLVLGGSQGGHASIATNEVAAEYAPELELVGAVALAPGAMFEETYGDEIVTRIISVMMLYGAAAEYPEIDVADYIGPAGDAASSVFEEGCLNEIIDAYFLIGGDALYTNDPATTEPARSVMLANDVGLVAVESPLFLTGGTADTTVVPARVDALFDRLCESGQVVEYLVLDGATHNNQYEMAATEIEAWIAARFVDEPAPDSCPTS